MSGIKANAIVSIWVRIFVFGLSLHLYPRFILRVVNALVSLCICTDSPEPSLLADAISIEISCTGPNDLSYINLCFFRIILIS